jgi:AcrR family transcriptional regulator
VTGDSDDEDATASDRPKRRRDSAATRDSILRSAYVAFTQHGYDGVGVREIAGDAGVTAMLINRYFGSKEKLFAEVVDVALTPRVAIGDDAATLARVSAERMVAWTWAEPGTGDPFQLLLRSAGNPRAAEILREAQERHVERHLMELLPGEHTAERAELFLSLIGGFWLMRALLRTPGLQAADEERLVRRLEAMLRPLVEPD